MWTEASRGRIADIERKFAECADVAGVAPARAKALFDQLQTIDRLAGVAGLGAA